MKRRWWFNVSGLTVAAMLMAACSLFSMGSSDSPDTEDLGKPGVVIDAPPSGSTAAIGEEVFVQSTSSDAVGITQVELQVEGAVVRTDSTPEGTPQTQFSVLQMWSATPGEHTLTVIAYRADGTPSDPASVTITVSEEAAAAAEDGSSACMAKASIQLAIRQGPGVDYPEIGYLELGEDLPVTGKNADSSWWQVDFNGTAGWISAPYTYSSGDCGAISVAQAPPAPAGGDHSGESDDQMGESSDQMAEDGDQMGGVGGGGDTASMDGEYSPTPSYTPDGPSPTPTYTYTPGGPTVTATYTYTPSPTPTNTLPGPTATYTYTPSPTSIYTPTPSYTPTTAPAPQQAPADANFNSPLNIPLDNTTSVLDFVSYPGGDTEDRVRWDITGMNPNSALSGGRARLIIAASCFGEGIETIEFYTGGHTYECGDTLVDREVTYDSRTGQVTITAVGGSETYVQWVLTGTATRTN